MSGGCGEDVGGGGGGRGSHLNKVLDFIIKCTVARHDFRRS